MHSGGAWPWGGVSMGDGEGEGAWVGGRDYYSLSRPPTQKSAGDSPRVFGRLRHRDLGGGEVLR
jgi:hypothetical protein